MLTYSAVNVKVKVPSNRLESPVRGRGIALHSLDLCARRGWVVSITPRSIYPWERPGTHCTGGWVGPRDGLDVCEKYRTVQPVASRYTDWAIPAPGVNVRLHLLSSTRYGNKWSQLYPGHFTPRVRSPRYPRAGLDVSEKIKVYCFCLESKPLYGFQVLLWLKTVLSLEWGIRPSRWVYCHRQQKK
jgi:hypothetical protein